MSRQCMRFLRLSLLPILLAGCQKGAGQEQGIEVPKTAHIRTAAEMKDAVGTQGYTAWGYTSNGAQFVSYSGPDGVAKTKSGNFTDTGVWHVSGNDLCLKWHKIRNGAETCFTEYEEGSNIYNVLPNGQVVSVATHFAPGNPEHL